MDILKRTLVYLHWTLLVLACAPAAFAADDLPPQSYAWRWWSAMYWSVGWVFPLICFGIMIAMFVFMMRRGGMGCMWRAKSAHKSGFRDDMNRFLSDPSAYALDILNERYAKGEIGKEEYEEKKAAIK